MVRRIYKSSMASKKKKFCRKCGQELRLINGAGELCPYGLGVYRFEKRYNRNTGLELQLWSCPNFGTREEWWLLGKDTYGNGHDKYPEDD